MRLLRANVGLNQGQFGRIINRGRDTISAWEHGERVPDDWTLAELAARAGARRTYFVDDELHLPSREDAASWRKAYDRDSSAADQAGLRALDAAAGDVERTARGSQRQESEQTD